jgi:hypothetical protein
MCVCVLLLMMLLGRKYLVLSVVLNLCAEISLYSALPSQSTASMVFIPCNGNSQDAEIDSAPQLLLYVHMLAGMGRPSASRTPYG